MDLRLDGRTAIVTGGSRGIGKAIATAFAAAGANVMITARKAETLQQTATEIGAGVAWFAGHVGEPAAWITGHTIVLDGGGIIAFPR
jgi:NAD(P)-dependent dehydrogenase (short-subunit alcohol dehydrogenase family)